jgi:glutathione peroxidase
MLKTIIILVAFLGGLSTTSIYDLQVTAIDGSTINLSSFQGKKVLFVNTASNSKYVNQYASLEQLYQLYKDSLVVIAFPSNSFGNEPGNASSIQTFVNNTYNIHYFLAAPVSVSSGSTQSPIYQWLTQISQNGTMNNQVTGDFDKFLMNGSGKLVGEFGSRIDPMDSIIVNAIKASY